MPPTSTPSTTPHTLDPTHGKTEDLLHVLEQFFGTDASLISWLTDPATGLYLASLGNVRAFHSEGRWVHGGRDTSLSFTAVFITVWLGELTQKERRRMRPDLADVAFGPDTDPVGFRAARVMSDDGQHWKLVITPNWA